MPLWPLSTDASRIEHPQWTNATTLGTNVATGGTAHTKTASWVQLVASTSFDADGLVLRTSGHNAAATASPALLDIAIGASGQEQILIPNAASATTFYFPVQIQAGTRISAKAQGARTSVNINIALDLYGAHGLIGNVAAPATWNAYGISTANSRGTAVTPGNSNTWGSWVDLGATTSDHDWWQLLVGMGANTATTAITYRAMLAPGANSTEAEAVATSNTPLNAISFFLGTNEANSFQRMVRGRYSPVKSGDHIWAKATASGTAQTIYVSAYGGM